MLTFSAHVSGKYYATKIYALLDQPPSVSIPAPPPQIQQPAPPDFAGDSGMSFLGDINSDLFSFLVDSVDGVPEPDHMFGVGPETNLW